MSADLADVLGMCVHWALTMALLFAVVHVDEAHFLREDQLARAWPIASRRSALVVFGLVALPVHFVRTRRSFLGVLLAIAALVVVGGLDVGIGELCAWVAPPAH